MARYTSQLAVLIADLQKHCGNDYCHANIRNSWRNYVSSIICQSVGSGPQGAGHKVKTGNGATLRFKKQPLLTVLEILVQKVLQMVT